MNMIRSDLVMVWSHLLPTKSLVVVVVVSGEWQTKFSVNPRGPDLDLSLTTLAVKS